ncbi:DUF2948 family protein [Wenxinia saemankumensis]|uniref:DUF2948 family protein n=1 Tax=Wenxinia saemankumensis TaxID=1447782 RepID=A0A1M6A8X2_9RHOB|nr:DUF2948 family protein [Wenxinia saemankumensis]SHI32922.1 Protein of unknown function [Wenxinia saemankumensis]
MSDQGPRDASFADGAERPLRLKALDAEDLGVISALVQDAVFNGSDMVFKPRERRFALLLGRFRWEDKDRAEARRRDYERVRTMLVVEDVQAVRSQGVPRGDSETVLSLLSLGWEPGEDGTGTLRLVLAGDGEIEVAVEALEVVLRDVTRPYAAPSGKAPGHEEN